MCTTRSPYYNVRKFQVDTFYSFGQVWPYTDRERETGREGEREREREKHLQQINKIDKLVYCIPQFF